MRVVDSNSNDLLSSVLTTGEPFPGPGVIKCTQGECEFSVNNNLGCHDACHTRSVANVFQYPFEFLDKIDLGTVDSCSRYESASNIATSGLDIPMEIEEGCTATCTGCDFFPTTIFPGPGLLECSSGRCSNYTYGSTFNDICPFEALEQASQFWGELSILGQGTDDAHTYVVFENINTYFPIVMTGGCTLECYGCSLLHRYLRG